MRSVGASAAGADSGDIRWGIFAIAVLASLFGQFYRTSPAVVAPDMLQSLALPAAFFGTMTSAYFIGATLVQIPAGMLFDRLGLRATVPALLLVGAVGAAMLGWADSPSDLILGRAVMGLGCGAIIMAAVVLCARMAAPSAFPTWVGFVLAAGQLGNLMSTAPMAWMSAALGWRGAFLALAAATVALALLYVLAMRDLPRASSSPSGEAEGVKATVQGSVQIIRDRRLWPLFAIAFVGYASIFAVMGAWGSVYLNVVHGLDLVGRGRVLLLMTACFAAGLFLFGWLARVIGNRPAVVAGVGSAVAIFAVLALVPDLPVPLVAAMFAGLGLAGGFSGPIIASGRAYYPPHLIGRGATVLNTVVLAGAALAQAWGGALLDVMARLAPSDPELGFRTMFALLGVSLLAGLAVYAFARDRASDSLALS